ncbi:MAG TPA: DUF503 domain-containing protein [Chloroflexota bacterium]
MARVVLHMPGNRSLKDKRQIVKSLLALVQQRFAVSAAEVERQDQWQVGVLGLACVSNEAKHVDQVLAKAVGFIQTTRPDAEMLEVETEILHAL